MTTEKKMNYWPSSPRARRNRETRFLASFNVCRRRPVPRDATGSVDERNHLRLWLTPLIFEGRDVWIGQISRDIGVRLSSKTITTHKIDPDVDETRDYLLQDTLLSGSLAGVGYVKGVGGATPEDPRFNYTLDPYFTDGLRLVLFVSEDYASPDDLELIWERQGEL